MDSLDSLTWRSPSTLYFCGSFLVSPWCQGRGRWALRVQHATQENESPGVESCLRTACVPVFFFSRRMDTLAASFSCLFSAFNFTRNETFSSRKILFLLSQALFFLSLLSGGSCVVGFYYSDLVLATVRTLVSKVLLEPENSKFAFPILRLHKIFPILIATT